MTDESKKLIIEMISEKMTNLIFRSKRMKYKKCLDEFLDEHTKSIHITHCCYCGKRIAVEVYDEYKHDGYSCNKCVSKDIYVRNGIDEPLETDLFDEIEIREKERVASVKVTIDEEIIRYINKEIAVNTEDSKEVLVLKKHIKHWCSEAERTLKNSNSYLLGIQILSALKADICALKSIDRDKCDVYEQLNIRIDKVVVSIKRELKNRCKNYEVLSSIL